VAQRVADIILNYSTHLSEAVESSSRIFTSPAKKYMFARLAPKSGAHASDLPPAEFLPIRRELEGLSASSYSAEKQGKQRRASMVKSKLARKLEYTLLQ